MRDCVFLVADKSMGETFAGFLNRPDRAIQLDCGPFVFDRNEDLFVAAGQNDPGVFKRAEELLSIFQDTHRRAVVVLDCEWDTSPGQTEICVEITRRLVASGWSEQNVAVIAIDPELEQWIWQDSPVLETVLRHQGPPSLRDVLASDGSWPSGQAKPTEPKDLFLQVQHRNRVKKSSSVFRRIASEVPVAACTDPEFRRLVAMLRTWFPPEVNA